MELENRFTVPVDVDTAWQVLLDVQRVAPCLPGAALDDVDGDTFTGTVKVKVGSITMTYRGKASFTEKDEAARRAVIKAAGKETRGAGTVNATVAMSLADAGGETEVTVHTALTITGRPAQFGRGVLADVSASIVKQFAASLAEQVST